MAYELGNGVNSLTEPNFCIVYCYSIFVDERNLLPSLALHRDCIGASPQVDSGVSEPVHCRGGELVQGVSGPCSIEEERDLD